MSRNYWQCARWRLPLDQAFRVSYSVQDRGVTMEWRIAKSYHLYRSEMVFWTDDDSVSLFPAEVAATDGLWFGGVSILKDRVRADLRFRLDEGKWRRFTLKARFVGCSDEGHCYPAREIVVPVDRTETQQ